MKRRLKFALDLPLLPLPIDFVPSQDSSLDPLFSSLLDIHIILNFSVNGTEHMDGTKAAEFDVCLSVVCFYLKN